MSRFSGVLICASFLWVTHLENGAQFLNATLVFASTFLAVYFLLEQYMHLNNHKDLIL